MIGAVVVLIVYFIAMWKLVSWYDKLYTKEWYWKFREKKKRVEHRIRRKKAKKEILAFQNN